MAKNIALVVLLLIVAGATSGYLGSKLNKNNSGIKIAILDSAVLLGDITQYSPDETQEKMEEVSKHTDELIKKGYIIISGEMILKAPKKYFIRIKNEKMKNEK